MRDRWVPEWGDLVSPEILEAIRAEYMPAMPEVQLGSYLLSYFLDVGPVEQSGMGDTVLSHQELRAYQDNIGIRLQPWEIRLIRRLSGEYLRAKFVAEKASAPAPWYADVEEDELQIVAQSLKQTIRQLAKL